MYILLTMVRFRDEVGFSDRYENTNHNLCP